MPRPRKLRPKRHERNWHEGSVREIRPGVWRAWREREVRTGGKIVRPSKTFSDADAQERAQLWAKGEPEPDVMYLGQWLERWLALRKPTIAVNTYALYARAAEVCGDLRVRPIADISKDDWQELTNTLLGQWSRYSVYVWKGNISTALRAAIPKYLTNNTIEGVTLPIAEEAPPKAWRQDEVDRLLAICAGTNHDAWVQFSLGTGVRLGEARALLWEDVDLVKQTATIRASLDNATGKRGPTKTRKLRVVDLPDELLPVLAEHAKRQAPGETLVFGHGNKPYRTSALREWLKRRCKQAGVRELTPHSFRHTYASLALADGVPVTDVAHQLGHTVETCQRIYAHYIGEGLRRAANAIGKALRNRFTGPKRANGTSNGTSEVV